MESRGQKSHLEVVRYPYENPEEGMIGISGKGEVYVYCDNEWLLMKNLEEWEEVYDAEGKSIGRVKGSTFEDYRVLKDTEIVSLW